MSKIFEAGYRERVNFEEEIGVYVFPTGIREPTSFGVIHHDSDGRYHVVPARPDSLEEDRSLETLLLSCQRALIGEVTPSLRGVAVKWRDDCILMIFYHQGVLNQGIENEYYCIATEVIADYIDAKIAEKIIRCDAPKPLPKFENTNLVYLRKEPFIDPHKSFVSRLMYRVRCLRLKCRDKFLS